MKNAVLLALVATLAVSVDAQDTIPNASFEVWTNNALLGPAPNGWVTTNGATQNRAQGYGISQSSDAVLGSSAAKITTGRMYNQMFGIDDTSAQLMTGVFSMALLREQLGFPYVQRPAVLRCQYKYFPMEPIGQDTARIFVHFHKWNVDSSRHDVIGVGELKMTDTVAAYTPVDVPIAWSSPDSPDSAHIEFASSLSRLAIGYSGTSIHHPIIGATLYVDAVELVMATPVVAQRERIAAPGVHSASSPLYDLRGRLVHGARASSGVDLRIGAYVQAGGRIRVAD